MTTPSALRSGAPCLVEAAELLKLMANANRLAILCHLVAGDSSVGQMEEQLAIRQPTLSQQIGELRKAGLIEDRRKARTVFYRLTDPRTRALAAYLHQFIVGREPTLMTSIPAPTQAGPSATTPCRGVRHVAVFARLLDGVPRSSDTT